MSLARGANYSQAGMHATLSQDQYDVRDSVRIRDGMAGSAYMIYEGTEQDDQLKKRSWKPGLTILHAGLILLIVLVALAVIYSARSRQLNQLAVEVNRMNDSINALVAENAQLTMQLEAQKEESRIDYEAVQVLGMVPQEETEIYRISAPNPRPYEHKTKTAAGL